jgi:exopolysaccharide production protein ExoZ
MKTLFSLQYLRAIAALGVVVVHAVERRGWHFDLGQMGVDLFFVLSGLMMWLISDQAPRKPGEFFADRLGRIAPTYWLATVFVLLMWLAGIKAGLDRPEVWHATKSFLFIPAEYPGKEKIYPLVIPGWTLNYEMFFYAIFALALLARRMMRLAILTVAIAGLVLAGLILRPDGAIGATYTDPILLEFLVGVWLGVIWTSRVNVGPALCLFLVASGAGLLALLSATHAPRVLVWGVPAALIVAGIALNERHYAVPKWPWLLLLGDASYSIYLWHFPTNSFWDRLAQMIHAPAWLAVVIMVVCGTAFGVAAHLLIEKPVRLWLRRRRKRSRISGRPAAQATSA